jgi:hypothetical protein
VENGCRAGEIPARAKFLARMERMVPTLTRVQEEVNGMALRENFKQRKRTIGSTNANASTPKKVVALSLVGCWYGVDFYPHPDHDHF